MDMTVVVTRNAPERFRGFLAGCMLELAPGVYANPRMSDGVRQRVWEVLLDWGGALPGDGGILMTWKDASSPSGQALWMLGWPKKEIVEHEGFWLVRSEVSAGDAD
jgi:CRISPR-associated protein Cas2